jgi:NAD(P)-dependent dehydrogenase (short-subunit alcohol dehydrogenase family)
MAPLAGTRVVVVGGSSGIGFAVAKAAHAEGAHVIIASSTETRCAAAVQRLGGKRAESRVLDIQKEESIKAFFEAIGNVDHLVYTVSTPA